MQTSIYADIALNAEIFDVEGNRYLDFSAGIAVVNTGHCHPKVGRWKLLLDRAMSS